MSYETKFQQKGERGPAERASFQRDKIRSDSLADIEKPTNAPILYVIPCNVTGHGREEGKSIDC